MSIIKAIKTRSSNAFMSDQAVTLEVITEILDAGVCGPNHYRTNPWRFLVITGEGRNRFGDFMADRMMVNMEHPDSPENIALLDKIRKKPLRAPVIIVAGAAKPEIGKALMVEEVAAVSAACQNILLAADELGLSAIWRTGSLTYAQDTVTFLGFEPSTNLVGFIYLGYPRKDSHPKARESSADYTRWMPE